MDYLNADTLSYHETIKALFDVLATCNNGDHDMEAQDWQKPRDASQQSAFGHVYDAIKALAGDAILEAYCEIGEIDLSLASRN
tara:strand:+ start:151 stop:399 length:249 start_codon:yes stop_codon:yes gene_type:complete